MDNLGDRLIRDQERIREKRKLAAEYERLALLLRNEADEIERLAKLARSA